MFELAILPWHYWLILAALLLTAEIFTSGFVLAGLGFAAAVAAAAHYLTQDTGWALAGFCIASLVFFAGIRPLALRTFMESEPSPFGVQAMLGQQVIIGTDQSGDGGLQTTFRDSKWSVSSTDDLAAGDRAEITGVDSTTLIVKRVN
jgi:membrane protein implicated in regulation of membrane protease activity